MYKFYFKDELIFPFEEELSQDELIEQRIKQVKIVDTNLKNMIKSCLVDILNSRND